jgi:ADP-ribose pyrophosphatase
MADEILLQAGKFRVVRRTIDTGLPQQKTKDIIIHPGATVILPITDDGKVVMISNHRWTVNRDLLELPAGTLEPLEDPNICAVRELEEETGFIAGTLRPLCRFYTSPGCMTELMHAFIATDLKKGHQNLSGDEQIKVEIMSFDEIEHAIRIGKIMDGKTLAVLMYYKLLEKK